MKIPNEVKALSIPSKDNKLKIIFLGNPTKYAYIYLYMCI